MRIICLLILTLFISCTYSLRRDREHFTEQINEQLVSEPEPIRIKNLIFPYSVHDSTTNIVKEALGHFEKAGLIQATDSSIQTYVLTDMGDSLYWKGPLEFGLFGFYCFYLEVDSILSIDSTYKYKNTPICDVSYTFKKRSFHPWVTPVDIYTFLDTNTTSNTLILRMRMGLVGEEWRTMGALPPHLPEWGK